MNKIKHFYSLTIAITCLFFFPDFPARAESPLPKPLVPLHSSGEDYMPHLEKMEKLLEEGKIFALYTEIQNVKRKMNSNMEIRRVKGKVIHTHEEVVAFEWLAYYVSSAPPFTADMFDLNVIPYDARNFDFSWKASIAVMLLNEDIEKKAKSLSVDTKKINTLHIIYLQKIFNSFFDSKLQLEISKKKEMSRISKIDEELRKAGHEPKSDFDRLEELKSERNRTVKMLSLKNYRISECRFHVEGMEKKFVDRIIKSFPHDGKGVQDAIIRSGYNSKEKCRDLLLRTTVRDKNTEYLFIGLPRKESKK
jgi:hypothetical protein